MKVAIRPKNDHRKTSSNGLGKINMLNNHSKDTNWSIEDANSFRTNKFLETHLEQLDELTERVAERIRCFSHQKEVAFRSRQNLTYHTEANSGHNNDQGLLKGHLTSLANIINRIQNKLK